MPRLVVTGSRNGHPELSRWLTRWVDRFGKPEFAVVGDNDDTDDSVDKRAHEFFAPLCMVVKVCVNPLLASPWRFHDRNQRMVDSVLEGDWLLAFPDSESRGTYDCYRRGKKRGLQCRMATVAGLLKRPKGAK